MEMNEIYLYPYSAEEARQRDELSLWRASHQANITCKEAIEKAVRQHFDGFHLGRNCLDSVLEKFGFKRTAWVLANTIHQLERDGRFSSRNIAWAQTVHIPPDKRHDLDFVVTSHPAVLDGVVDQYRSAYEFFFMLYGPEHCEPRSTEELDYQDKVLVLSPESLKESSWILQEQLWYAHDGDGCSPTAIGGPIRCTCLDDGVMTWWDRSNFIGVLKEKHLPEWARERLRELKSKEIQQMSRPEMERSLAERIDLAWSKYETSLRSLSSSEIMGQIEDVSAVRMCRNALLKDMDLYSDEQLTFLLSLFDPLEQMKDHLVREQEADQMEQVNFAIRSLQKELQEEQKIDTPGQGEMTMK